MEFGPLRFAPTAKKDRTSLAQPAPVPMQIGMNASAAARYADNG